MIPRVNELTMYTTVWCGTRPVPAGFADTLVGTTARQQLIWAGCGLVSQNPTDLPQDLHRATEVVTGRVNDSHQTGGTCSRPASDVA